MHLFRLLILLVFRILPLGCLFFKFKCAYVYGWAFVSIFCEFTLTLTQVCASNNCRKLFPWDVLAPFPPMLSNGLRIHLHAASIFLIVLSSSSFSFSVFVVVENRVVVVVVVVVVVLDSLEEIVTNKREADDGVLMTKEETLWFRMKQPRRKRRNDCDDFMFELDFLSLSLYRWQKEWENLGQKKGWNLMCVVAIIL